MILSSAVLSQYTRVTDKQTTDDDRKHFIGIAELAVQLQRTAKKSIRAVVSNNSTVLFSVAT